MKRFSRFVDISKKLLFYSFPLVLSFGLYQNHLDKGYSFGLKKEPARNRTIPLLNNVIPNLHRKEYLSVDEDGKIVVRKFGSDEEKALETRENASSLIEQAPDGSVAFVDIDGNRRILSGGLEKIVGQGGSVSDYHSVPLDKDISLFSNDSRFLVCLDEDRPESSNSSFDLSLYDRLDDRLIDVDNDVLPVVFNSFDNSFLRLWWHPQDSCFVYTDSSDLCNYDISTGQLKSIQMDQSLDTVDFEFSGKSAFCISVLSDNDAKYALFRLDEDFEPQMQYSTGDFIDNLTSFDGKILFSESSGAKSSVKMLGRDKDGRFKVSEFFSGIDGIIADIEAGEDRIFIQTRSKIASPIGFSEESMRGMSVRFLREFAYAPDSQIFSIDSGGTKITSLIDAPFSSLKHSLVYSRDDGSLFFVQDNNPFFHMANPQIRKYDLSTGSVSDSTELRNPSLDKYRFNYHSTWFLSAYCLAAFSSFYLSERLKNMRFRKQHDSNAGTKDIDALDVVFEYPLVSSFTGMALYAVSAGTRSNWLSTLDYNLITDHFIGYTALSASFMTGASLFIGGMLTWAKNFLRRPYAPSFLKYFSNTPGYFMGRQKSLQNMVDVLDPKRPEYHNILFRKYYEAKDYDMACASIEGLITRIEQEKVPHLANVMEHWPSQFSVFKNLRAASASRLKNKPKKVLSLLSCGLDYFCLSDTENATRMFQVASEEAAHTGLADPVSVLYARVLAMQPKKSAQAEQQWNRSIESIFSHEQHGLQRVSDSKNIVVAPEGSYLEGAFRFKIGSQKALELENQRIQRYEQAYGNSLHSYGIFRVPLKNLVPEDRPLTGVQERIRQMAQETGQDHVHVLATRYHKGSSLTQIVDEYLHDADKQQSLFEAYAHSTVFLGTTLAQEPVPSEAVYSTEDMLRERFERPISPYSDEQAETIIRNISPVSDLIDCSAYVIDNDPHPDNLKISQDTEGKPVVTEIDLEDKGVVPYAVSLGLFLSYSGVSSKDGSDIRVLSAQQQQTLVDSFVEAYNSQAKNYNRDMIDPAQAHLAAMAGIISTGLSMSVSWSDPKRPSLAPKRMDVLKSALNAIDDIARAPQYKGHYEQYQHNYAALQAVMQEKLHELN